MTNCGQDSTSTTLATDRRMAVTEKQRICNRRRSWSHHEHHHLTSLLNTDPRLDRAFEGNNRVLAIFLCVVYCCQSSPSPATQPSMLQLHLSYSRCQGRLYAVQRACMHVHTWLAGAHERTHGPVHQLFLPNTLRLSRRYTYKHTRGATHTTGVSYSQWLQLPTSNGQRRPLQAVL